MAVKEPIDPGFDEHFQSDYARMRASRVRMESITNFVSRALGYGGFLLALIGLMLFILK